MSSNSQRCDCCAEHGKTVAHRYRPTGRVDAAGGLLEAMLARQWEGTVWLANAFHTQFGTPLPEFMSVDLVAVSARRAPPSGPR